MRRTEGRVWLTNEARGGGQGEVGANQAHGG